ncbi:MAG: acetyltransferase [Propionibacteriales bacterium]|nr:acetyltransferase [Propionibacteriales bacterium]
MGIQKLVIIGCGGFGRGLSALLDEVNAVEPTYELLGYLDDGPIQENLDRLAALGIPFLGDQTWLETAPTNVAYVIGIGHGEIRRLIAERFADRPAAVLIHPHSTHAADAEFGPGTILCAGARVSTNVRLGDHVHLNMNVTIGNDVTLGDFTTVHPLVSVSAGVTSGAGVTFGTNSTILPELTVGTGAILGAGACAVRDVSPGIVVKGVPAR